MDYSTWVARCAARYVEQAGLCPEDAHETAEVCFVEDHDGDFEDDPEGAADEDMSNWTDDEA